MKLQVAMTCIAANYERLWKELKPEPSQELWKMAQQQWMSDATHPVRSYYTDYLERREAENQERPRARYDYYGSYTEGQDLCDAAAAVDKEPTSTYLRERIDLPMLSEAQVSVYSDGWQANAAEWELFICSSEEQQQKARDRGSHWFWYESEWPELPEQSEHGGARSLRA
jgi:hypothetical protein